MDGPDRHPDRSTACDGYEYFVAEQIGVPTLYAEIAEP
jgi:hypothetical protein